MTSVTHVIEYVQANLFKMRDLLNAGTYDIIKLQDGTQPDAEVIAMMLPTSAVTARDGSSLGHSTEVYFGELALNPTVNTGGLYDIIHTCRQYQAETVGGVKAARTMPGAAAPNSSIVYTSRAYGASTITVDHINAGGDKTLLVSVTGYALSVRLATTAGVITSAANDVIAAIQAHAVANDLVVVTKPGTGAGRCADEGPLALTGGLAVPSQMDYWKIFAEDLVDTGLCIISKSLADQLHIS